MLLTFDLPKYYFNVLDDFLFRKIRQRAFVLFEELQQSQRHLFLTWAGAASEDIIQ